MGQIDPDRPAMGVQLDRESADGAKVIGLSKPSPAGEAGIEVGDIIRRVGDKKIGEFADLVKALEKLKVDQRVKIAVDRGDEELEFEVKLGRLGKLLDYDRGRRGDDVEEEEEEPLEARPSLGVQLELEAEGAKVYEVVPGSAAAAAGIEPGDVILKIDGKEIGSAPEMAENIGGRKPGDKVKMLLRRGDDEKELEVELGKAGE